MTNTDEKQHLISRIENTKKNRDFVKDLNKKMRQSNSMYRITTKYRQPKNGYRKGYSDGSVPKSDATTFSLYLRNTEKQNNIQMDRTREAYRKASRMEEKYNVLLQKYNKMMLKPIVRGLIDNMQELEYALDNGVAWKEVTKSLSSLAKGITSDINKTLEGNNADN